MAWGNPRKFRCVQDPNTRELVCESFKENKDGTKTELASLRAQIDASCTPVITDMSEAGEGEFDKLEKKVTKRLTAKCKGTPADY